MIRYYLHTKTGRVWKIDPATGADLSGNNLFLELDDAEIAFYLQCQADGYVPTPREIIDQKRADPQQGTISVAVYKEVKLSELDYLSLSTFEKMSPKYKIENARLGVYDDETNNDILTIAKANAILCRDEFYRIHDKIKNAKSIKGVDNAFNANQYATFE